MIFAEPDIASKYLRANAQQTTERRRAAAEALRAQ